MPGFDARIFGLIHCEFADQSLASEGESVRAEVRHQLKQDRFSKVTFEAAGRTFD